MKLILHSYRRCPFCIRVRILLALKKIPYELIEEPLREWTPWMKAWSEKTGERARVPVLRAVLDDGIETIIPESNTINIFLDTYDSAPEYMPEEGTSAYAEMLEWFLWCAKELKPILDIYKYGVDRIFVKEVHGVHTEALSTCLKKLETALSGKQYLLEERLTLADIAIIPFIRQIMRTREGEFDFTPFPRIEAWSNILLQTEWFEREVMKK